jgi:hypothetical protein
MYQVMDTILGREIKIDAALAIRGRLRHAGGILEGQPDVGGSGGLLPLTSLQPSCSNAANRTSIDRKGRLRTIERVT